MSAPLQLLLLRNPRTLVLASQDWVLLFRSPPEQPPASSTTSTDAVSIVVELLPRYEVDLDGAVVLNGRVSGCLGVLSVANGSSPLSPFFFRFRLTLFAAETFLAIITHSTSVGAGLSRSSSAFTGLGCEPIFQVRAVDFFCLSSAAFDYLHAPVSSFPLEHSDYIDDSSSFSSSTGGYPTSTSSSTSYGSPSSSSPYATSNGVPTSSLRGQDPTPVEHPCQSLRKILSNSSFYYSSGPDAFDLSTRLQARVGKAARTKEEERRRTAGGGAEGEKVGDETKPDQDGYQQAALDHDARFLWNTYLVAPLLSFRSTLSAEMVEVFDREGFMVLATQRE